MSKLTIVCIGLASAIVVMGIVLVCVATKPPAVVKAQSPVQETQDKSEPDDAEVFSALLENKGSFDLLEKHGWVLRFDHEAQLCIIDHEIWVYLTQYKSRRWLLLYWIGNEMGKHNKKKGTEYSNHTFTAFSSVTGQSLGYVDSDREVHIFR